jgi:hypothetical protein
MLSPLDSFKLKIFDDYLKDTGSSYEGFISDNNLQESSDDQITQTKLKIIDDAIAIMGKEDLFRNYLSEEDFSTFKEQGL